jgi:hypothetical protein
MADDERFALVVRTGRGTFAPDCPFDHAVCLVEGGTATLRFVDLEGVSKAVGATPCVPSAYGAVAGRVSIEAEREALDTVARAAAGFSAKYARLPPPGFEAVPEPRKTGVSASVSSGRFSIDIEGWVADELGWHAGDRVSLSRSPDGRHCLRADRDGDSLAPSGADALTTLRTWPAEGAFLDAEVLALEHWIAEGTLMFRAPAGGAPRRAVEVPGPARTRFELPRRRGIGYRWGFAALAVLYAALALCV